MFFNPMVNFWLSAWKNVTKTQQATTDAALQTANTLMEAARTEQHLHAQSLQKHVENAQAHAQNVENAHSPEQAMSELENWRQDTLESQMTLAQDVATVRQNTMATLTTLWQRQTQNAPAKAPVQGVVKKENSQTKSTPSQQDTRTPLKLSPTRQRTKQTSRATRSVAAGRAASRSASVRPRTGR